MHRRYRDLDEIRWAFKDFPQDSVLSPLLYNVYVSEIKSCCVPECNIIQYADDIALYLTSHNQLQGKLLLENSKNIVHTLLLLGLDLSAEKT